MPYKTPEQLEAEADAILRQEGQLPPEETPPDSGEHNEDKPETEPETEPEAAAAETGTDTPPPVEGDEAPAETETASPEANAPESDELEGLTLENSQERIRNAQARMHRATQETAEIRHQNAELTNRLQTLEGQVTSLQTELNAEAAPPDPDSEPQTGKPYASLQALRDDYPSLIDPMLEVANSLGAQVKALATKVTSLGGKVDEVSGTVTQSIDADAKTRKAEARKKHDDAILAKHKDAFEIAESGEFKGWLDRQPPMYRVAIQRGSAVDIIDVLDKYKKAVGETRLQAAREVATPTTPKVRTQPTKTKPTFTQQQIKDMSPQEFARREPEIDLAIAEGRVS